MTVSIILATKDRPEWIERAVLSVLVQDDPDWQLVVLDNGHPVRHLIPGDERITYRHADASGPADAYAQALALASGEYVMPLADDDVLAPETVATVNRTLALCEWGYARTAYWRDGQIVLYLGEPWDLARLRSGYYLGGAVFWRKSLSDRLGGFDPRYDHAADYALYLRFGEAVEPVFVPEVLYHYTDHPGTDTNRHRDLQIASEVALRA